jgi:hypothetical protein
MVMKFLVLMNFLILFGVYKVIHSNVHSRLYHSVAMILYWGWTSPLCTALCKSTMLINGFSLSIWKTQSYCKDYKARLPRALQYL